MALLSAVELGQGHLRARKPMPPARGSELDETVFDPSLQSERIRGQSMYLSEACSTVRDAVQIQKRVSLSDFFQAQGGVLSLGFRLGFSAA